MQPWEVLLSWDHKADLCEPGNAARALTRFLEASLGVLARGVVHPASRQAGHLRAAVNDWFQDARHFNLWGVCVHALRLIAVELRGATARPHSLPPADAAKIFEHYVGLLKPCLSLDEGAERVVRRGSFGGVSHCVATTSLTDMTALHATIWQWAFGSLAGAIHWPVCDRCQAWLGGTTPGGRARRATLCPKCVAKRHAEKLGPDGVRESDRRRKRRQRKNAILRARKGA